MQLVVDCSALVFSTVRTDSAAVGLRRRIVAADCHAPHLIDAEVGSALRRMTLRGELSAEHARVVLRTAGSLVEHRYPHRRGLADVAWSLRDRVGFCDGLYVALAAALGVPLLTLDSRLAGAGSLPCRVEVVG
ncbi:MAG TPA: PIN domain-containing protein [Nocardioidaceae bacterium]|nr:PIN domain-containing protein [Nocardioidaceae bacterium]